MPASMTGNACTMNELDDLSKILSGLVAKLLKTYDKAVTERSAFPDLRAAESVQFGDPTVSRPGRVELVVMHMDPEIDPTQDFIRFINVRVMKSREWGWCSSTGWHGRKTEVRATLEELKENPAPLVDRVRELSDGLPEETDPDVWR